MTNIGANIKKIRTTKGLSQQAFADLFELTRGNISSYEENRAEPRIDTVVRIANHFCIPLDNFVKQTLTINEILQFNGDKLIDDANHIINLQMREVPFMNDNIYMKCSHRELQFSDWSTFPKLVLPEAGNLRLVALTFNHNIPRHASTSQFQVNDVLIFEEVTQQNIHLCQHKTGLYAAEHEIMIGQFEMKEGQTDLILNDFKKHRFNFKQEKLFWKLFGVYQRVG